MITFLVGVALGAIFSKFWIATYNKFVAPLVAKIKVLVTK